uniref:VQ motif-containing protein 29-like n=1 Tax=Cicer arietinum TaxID=3827 RepID=A0A1S2YY79_CICAR|nr:VQ motif-containing protein 29-like [Cicer arietinum]
MEAYSSSYPTSNKSHNNSVLHSVRKSQSKPWKKASVAPQPSTAIRVYEVDVMNFREVVQQLTGAPEFKPQIHHQIVQNVATPSVVTTNWYKEVQSQESSGRTKNQPGLLELNLSSTSWCSSLS